LHIFTRDSSNKRTALNQVSQKSYVGFRSDCDRADCDRADRDRADWDRDDCDRADCDKDDCDRAARLRADQYITNLTMQQKRMI
jgi:hypothetical protein